MNIRNYNKTVEVAGTAGSATGSGDTARPVNGYIEAIKVVYTTQPATCDVTITEKASGQPILTLTNANSDGWFYPRTQMDGTDGSAISDQYVRIPVSDYVNIAVAGGNDGSVAVILKVDEG